jgi:hypothetical protein
MRKIWNRAQQQLARAVFAATKQEAFSAPKEGGVPSGTFLLHTFNKVHFKCDPGSAPRRISEVTEGGAVTVFNANLDQNRFTGIIPAIAGAPELKEPRRGGVYCSKDVRATMAELYHYADSSLARGIFGNASLKDVFLPKCYSVLQTRAELDVVNLNPKSSNMQSFLDKVQKHNAVHEGLKELRYEDLFHALLNKEDHSAARGFGLGLATNPKIEGLHIPSARDYDTEVGGRLETQTGDNVVLFGGENEELRRVRVASMHVVERNASGILEVKHFIRSNGFLEETSSEALPP